MERLRQLCHGDARSPSTLPFPRKNAGPLEEDYAPDQHREALATKTDGQIVATLFTALKMLADDLGPDDGEHYRVDRVAHVACTLAEEAVARFAPEAYIDGCAILAEDFESFGAAA